MADDPCSEVGDDSFSLFASVRLEKKKKSKSSRETTRGKADAVGDVDEANGNAIDDGDDVIEAAPPSTPAASKALAKGTEVASDDEDDALVTFKSLGLSDWLCRYGSCFFLRKH